MAREESKLIRNLGFTALMSIAVGQIIGAGIMSQTGIAIGMTGTGVFLAFIVSPILTLIQNMPSVYFGANLPVTGGNYRYVSRILGKEMGFIFTALYITGNLTIALYALTFSSYWVSILPGNGNVIAIIMLTLFFVANILGTKEAAFINTLMTVAMLAGIVLFIAFGIVKVDFSYVMQPQNLFTNGPRGFISSLALLSFATGGAQVIVNFGGEAKNPGKLIPLVMLTSTIGVGILYAFMAAVASGVLPMEQVANQPLTAVAKEVLPTVIFYLFVIGSAMGAAATTMNATLSWVSRGVLVACEDGLLPKGLAKVSKKGVPVIILTLFYIVGMIPLLTGLDISFVSRFGTSASLLQKILLCAAFIKVVDKYPEHMTSGIMKISAAGVKAVGAIAGIVTLVLSVSLILELPAWAIYGFFGIVAAASLYAFTGLKKVTLPDDLTIDYTTTTPTESEAQAV